MSLIKTIFTKDPDAVLDYGFDWGTNWLATGETIATSTWVVPTGITEDSATKTTLTTTIWLSGGTVNTTYEFTNRIITSAGRTDDRSFKVRIRQR